MFLNKSRRIIEQGLVPSGIKFDMTKLHAPNKILGIKLQSQVNQKSR